MLYSGDVVRVDFGLPRGSIAGFERPAVIVTSDHALQHAPRTLHVVPLTTNITRRLTSEISIEPPRTPRPSAAQCHLLQVISVEQLVDEAAGHTNVGPVALAQIRSIIGDLLDVG